MTRTPSYFLLGILLLTAQRALCDSRKELFAGPYIAGSSVYTARDFAPQIAPLIGQPTSRAIVGTLQQSIRGRYKRDGYVTPVISIPAGDMQASNPRLIIREARLSAVEIQGDPGPYRAQIEQLARLLKEAGPLRKEELRSVLARISQLPGISSRPIFDPRPDSTNEFLLILHLQYRPVEARVELNNGGTEGLGRELLEADVMTNDLLGLEEQLHLTGAVSSHPDRYQYEDAHIQRSIFQTTLFVDVSDSKAVPAPDLNFRDVHFSTGVAEAWAPTNSVSLSLGASFNGDNGSIRGSGDNGVILDHDRSASLGLTIARDVESQPGRVYVGAERGLDVAGSVVNEGDTSQVDPTYTKYSLSAEQVMPLGSSWSVKINMSGQATSAVLPLLDRFAFGGIGFGAAFDPGSLSGDSGAEVGAELAHVVKPKLAGLQSVRLYLRSDTGVVWNNASYFYHREEATSVGGGLSARWPHVGSTIEISTPLDTPPYVSAPSVRAFGSVVYIF